MFKKIIIATDLSDASSAVINCMKDFKNLGVEEVILFYACGIKYNGPMADVIKDSIEPTLNAQKDIIEKQGFKTSIEIAPGLPVDELKLFAANNNISLIVVGSHGENVLEHVLFRIGNVTSEIMHSHEKPLLIVRTKVVSSNGKEIVQATCQTLKEKILFATDFSDISMRAFQYVEKLVEDGCKKVTLLHVQDKVKIEKYLSDKLEEFNRIDTERLEMRKKQLLDRARKKLK